MAAAWPPTEYTIRGEGSRCVWIFHGPATADDLKSGTQLSGPAEQLRKMGLIGQDRQDQRDVVWIHRRTVVALVLIPNILSILSDYSLPGKPVAHHA